MWHQYGGKAIRVICIVSVVLRPRGKVVPDRAATVVLDLGKTVKEAVRKQDMLAWQYNTIGVSDAITMGNEGMSADLTVFRRLY